MERWLLILCSQDILVRIPSREGLMGQLGVQEPSRCAWPVSFVGRTGLRATAGATASADVTYKEELQSLCEEFRSKQEDGASQLAE